MTTIHQKKQNNKNIIGTLFAELTGAAAVIGIMALRDEKTRKRVNKVLTDIKDQAIGYMKVIKKESNTEEEAQKGNKKYGTN